MRFSFSLFLIFFFSGACLAASTETGQRPELRGTTPSTSFSYKAQRQRAYRDQKEFELKKNRSLSQNYIERNPLSRWAQRQQRYEEVIDEQLEERDGKVEALNEQFAEYRERLEDDKAAGYRRQYNLRVVGDERYERFNAKFRTLDNPAVEMPNAVERFYNSAPAQLENIEGEEILPEEELFLPAENISPKDDIHVEEAPIIHEEPTAPEEDMPGVTEIEYRQQLEQLIENYNQEMKRVMDQYKIQFERYQKDFRDYRVP